MRKGQGGELLAPPRQGWENSCPSLPKGRQAPLMWNMPKQATCCISYYRQHAYELSRRATSLLPHCCYGGDYPNLCRHAGMRTPYLTV